ncbi:MAG: type II toxin-antitoxin system RelE/ParE family toxin [Deltaproteobacteria bacterium]|nr:type II toxin-antitoxin system RelE/ParE family toxin [Deltaproteobacteria bacterium]
MRFEVVLLPDAKEDLDYFTAFEQRIIMAAIKKYLTVDAHLETKRRKQLEDNPVAPWELKQEPYRIFYDVIGDRVDVLAIGYKEHNELFIRGKKVEL